MPEEVKPVEEAKIVSYKDGKILVELDKTIDPNKDGEPLAGIKLSLWVDITELPDEAFDAYKARKNK